MVFLIKALAELKISVYFLHLFLCFLMLVFWAWILILNQAEDFYLVLFVFFLWLLSENIFWVFLNPCYQFVKAPDKNNYNWCNFFKIVLYQLFVVLMKVRLGVLFMKDVNPCILCLSDAYLSSMNHKFFVEIAVKIKILKWVFLSLFCSFISIDVKFRSYYNRYQFTNLILLFDLLYSLWMFHFYF